MSYTIRIEGLDRVQKLLGQDFGSVIRTASESIAQEIEDKLAPAPGPVHLPIVWASDRQRRYVMATRRKAGLGPYKRESDPMSQRIQASWVVTPRRMGASLRNKATYSGYVHSAKYQQPMHKATGWMTDRAAIEIVIRSGAVIRILLQAIMAKLRRQP